MKDRTPNEVLKKKSAFSDNSEQNKHQKTITVICYHHHHDQDVGQGLQLGVPEQTQQLHDQKNAVWH